MLYGQDLQWGTNVCSARAWGRAGERSCHGVWLCMFCVDDCIMTSTHCVCMFVVHCIFYASLHWHSCFHHTSVIFKWIAQYSNHLTHGGHVCVLPTILVYRWTCYSISRIGCWYVLFILVFYEVLAMFLQVSMRLSFESRQT